VIIQGTSCGNLFGYRDEQDIDLRPRRLLTSAKLGLLMLQKKKEKEKLKLFYYHESCICVSL